MIISSWIRDIKKEVKIMKYLKITIALFALTFIFAGTSANAEVIYNIQSITIPAYKIN